MNNTTPSQEKADMSEGVCTAQKASVPEKPTRTLSEKKIPVEDLGVKVLWKPDHEDDIDVDILAVPGIGTDPKTTWTYTERDPEDKSKVTKEVTWLSDPTMLPKEFPNARIMSFGYDSYWFGDAPARNRLSGIVTNVLKDLGQHRKDCERRPIILIGHCYGGIVLQQTYLTSHRHADDYPGIYDSITGIIFLGTPHQGSNISKMGSVGKIYDLILQQRLQIEDGLLQTIAQDNTILVDTVADFTREVQRRTARPELFCFFELRSTCVGAIAGLKDGAREFVVDESSGFLPGYEKRGLAVDHFSINKFGSNQDNHYISVVNELVKMGEKAKDIMRKRGEASINASRRTSKHSHSAAQRQVPMLPFPVAGGFAPRDGILEKIKARFDYSSKITLVGPCGSGKTHLAVEYADGFLRDNPGAQVFWVNASNRAEFELSFDMIKEKMKLKQGKKGDTMGAVCDYLKQGDSGQWLMVIDGLDQAGASNNADQPKESERAKDHDSLQPLIDYIPEGHTYGGQVLVTTRSKTVATRVVNHKYVVELSASLSEEDVVLLLGGGKAKSSSPGPYLTKIAGALQRSAGALALVYAYKETLGVDFSWRDLWRRVQDSASETNNSKDSSQTEERIRAMSGIWKPLYSQLEATHADAAQLLRILSLLDVQSIPMFLIEKRFDDKSQQAEQVKVLTDYDMLELSVNRRDARVTPMVRLSANAMLDSNRSDDASFLRDAALTLVTEAYPSADEADNIKCKVLRPCAMAALRLGSDSAEGHRKRARLLLNVAAFEKRVGRYDAALELLVQCLDLCKPGTKASDAALKRLQREAKKLLDETTKEQQRSQRRRSKEKGGPQPPAHHPEKLSDLKAIALGPESKADDVRRVSSAVLAAHRQPDFMEENIRQSKQILDWCRANHGLTHQDTARQLYNLALAHDAHGDHASAEGLYLEAIRAMEGVDGGGAPSAEALRAQGSLARMYGQQGRLADADALFRGVLRGQAGRLGPEHPETLLTRMNLALVAQDLRPGDPEAPARELRGVLASQARLLGDGHPATLTTACNLAQCYRAAGRAADAELLFGLALGQQRKSLGERHPDTVRTVAILKEMEDAQVTSGTGNRREL